MEEQLKAREIHLVLKDDGKDKFNFTMEGDIERIGMPSIPLSHYSAAEYWAAKLMELFKNELEGSGQVKKLNRADRRKG